MNMTHQKAEGFAKTLMTKAGALGAIVTVSEWIEYPDIEAVDLIVKWPGGALPERCTVWQEAGGMKGEYT